MWEYMYLLYRDHIAAIFIVYKNAITILLSSVGEGSVRFV